MQCVTILLCTTFIIAFAYEDPSDLIGYWINRNKQVLQDYMEHSCGECRIPFEVDDEVLYGCKTQGSYDLVCMNDDAETVRCPMECPSGKVRIDPLRAGYGANDESIILQCKGKGSRNPTMIWRKDGDVIREIAPPEHLHPVDIISEIFLRFDAEDYGIYSCELKNSHSSITSKDTYRGDYHFEGKRLPVPPDPPYIAYVRGENVRIEWHDYFWEDENRYKGYMVEIIPERIFENSTLVDVGREYGHTFKNLTPDIQYFFRLYRRNHLGYSQPSESINATFSFKAPESNFTNIDAINVTSTSVTLKWDWYISDPKYIGIKAYGITYTSDVDEGINSDAISTNNYTIRNLIPHTNYSFVITGYAYGATFERSSDPVYVKTLPSEPSITSLHVDDTDHLAITIVCIAEARPLPEIIWKKGSKSISTDQNTEVINKTSAIISRIHIPRTANSYRKYECVAENIGGRGAKTVKVEYRGGHPPVALENMILEMTEKLEELRVNVGAMQKDVEQTKQDMEQTKEAMEQTRRDMGIFTEACRFADDDIAD